MTSAIHNSPDLENPLTQAQVLRTWHEKAAAADKAAGPYQESFALRDKYQKNDKPRGGDFNGQGHEKGREENGKESREENGQEEEITSDPSREQVAPAHSLSDGPLHIVGIDPIVLNTHEPASFEMLPYDDDDFVVLYRYAPLKPILISVGHLKATPPRTDWLCACGPVPLKAP